MAAYMCPELLPTAVQEMSTEGVSCSEMDNEKPVHCGEFQAGSQLALQNLAAPPALTPILASFVVPSVPLPAPAVLAPLRSDMPLETSTDPPYLRTLRLRI